MKILDSYPVIVTEALRECRDFYVAWFEFEVAFEASWFVLPTQKGRGCDLDRFHAPRPSVIADSRRVPW